MSYASQDRTPLNNTMRYDMIQNFFSHVLFYLNTYLRSHCSAGMETFTKQWQLKYLANPASARSLWKREIKRKSFVWVRYNVHSVFVWCILLILSLVVCLLSVSRILHGIDDWLDSFQLILFAVTIPYCDHFHSFSLSLFLSLLLSCLFSAGTIYGMGPALAAAKLGIDIASANRITYAFFNSYKEMKLWMTKTKKLVCNIIDYSSFCFLSCHLLVIDYTSITSFLLFSHLFFFPVLCNSFLHFFFCSFHHYWFSSINQ